MEIFGRHIPFTEIKNASANRPSEADIRRFTQQPNQQVIRIRQDIGKWRVALQVAESVINPQRYQLYQLYKDVVLDAHLTACIQQRKNLTLSKSYKVVDSAGNEVEKKTAIIRSKWFWDFMDLALDSKFYGFSLVQFGDLLNDSFKTVELVPRIYVKPELHIVTETWGAQTGKDFLESPFKEWTIGVGYPNDLGLLAKAAPLIIWKKNALGAWSEFQEVFGSPVRIGKTNVRDNATRSNMENFLKNMGNTSYAVIDTEDIIDLVETNRTDAHGVFDMLIQRVNSEIAKLILGQTATTDEKSFVGSAEVQERVLANYAELDERFIEGVLNYQLIPLLNGLGMGFEGLKIESEDDEELTLQEAIKVDAEIMKYFDVDPAYILEKYGTPVEKKAIVAPVAMDGKVKNKLDELYQ